jgi:dipeptidyl aminopeptidase/acylaminoacyl peptidase
MRGSLLLALSLVLLARPVAAADPSAAPAPATLTAERLWELARLSSPVISPDGRVAVVAVTTHDMKEDKPQTRLWRVDLRTREAAPLTAPDLDSRNPVFSPDGRFLAFESKRGKDEVSQLYVLPMGGCEARRLTELPTGAGHARWFADGRQLAFISRVWPDLASWDDQAKRLKDEKERKVSAKTWDRAPLRHWDTWLDAREPHVYRVSLDEGEVQAITRGSGRFLPRATAARGHYDLAPDGQTLVFVADSDDSGIRPNLDLYRLPVAGGTAVNLTPDNPATDTAPRFSPDGRSIAYAQQAIVGFYADRARLTLVRPDGSGRRVLTEAVDRSFDSFEWTDGGRSLIAAVDDAGTTRLHRIRASDGRVTPLTGATSFGSFDITADGRSLIALNESFRYPPRLVQVPARGAPTTLFDPNAEALAAMDLGRYESLTYEGADGAPIQMWVQYPPGFDPAQKYPLYLLIHGGPHNGITDGWHWRWNAQVFSQWGYVTAWPNFHGSSGFGQAFTDSINPRWDDKPYTDVIKAAEWFAGQPWIDAKRMAAGGGSYGGYLSSILLGRDHPFQTLVIHAAVYNLITQYGADYAAAPKRHGEHWEVPEQYAQVSPHTQAANFKTPSLVIHGEQDYRVPLNHGIELFNTLQTLGVESRFVYYPDENHWILKPNNSLHWYGEKEGWLARFLKGASR